MNDNKTIIMALLILVLSFGFVPAGHTEEPEKIQGSTYISEYVSACNNGNLSGDHQFVCLLALPIIALIAIVGFFIIIVIKVKPFDVKDFINVFKKSPSTGEE